MIGAIPSTESYRMGHKNCLASVAPMIQKAFRILTTIFGACLILCTFWGPVKSSIRIESSYVAFDSSFSFECTG